MPSFIRTRIRPEITTAVGASSQELVPAFSQLRPGHQIINGASVRGR